MMLRTTLLLLVVACSDSSSVHTDANLASCGSIGSQCTTSCPDGLECVNGACAAKRGDCGGFAGAACADSSLVCAYPAGNSAGLCMRADEKQCLCAKAPNALGDCGN